MPDNIQNTQFPNGVDTSTIKGVRSIQYADGLSVSTTPVPVTLDISTMNVGLLNFRIANGNSINGRYSLKINVGGTTSYVNIDVSSQTFSGFPTMQHTIHISGVSDVNVSVLQISTVYLMKNSINNDLALIVRYNINATGSGTASIICDAIGNPAPLSISTNVSDWNVLVSSKTTDIRDTFNVYSRRINGNNVSLNNIRNPGSVTVSPTDLGSRPTGSSGFGTCFVFGSSDSSTITQIFNDTVNDNLYIRHMLPDNVTWSTWSKILRDVDIEDIIENIDQKVMMSSIVFG